MTTQQEREHLRCRTIEIDDPGDLSRYAGAAEDVLWLRDGDGMVGLGIAERAEVDSPQEAAEWWADQRPRLEHETELPGVWGTGPLAFGSFAFDPRSTAERSVLVVPRTIIGRRAGRAWLTTVGHEDTTVPQPAAPGPLPHLAGQPESIPPRDAWLAAVRQALSRVGDPATALRSVVLTRTADVRTDVPLSPAVLADRLAASHPACWTFAVEGLVGASPRLLIRVEGGLATSRVVAGTLHRGSGSVPEAVEALLTADAALADHRDAVAAVEECLRPLCAGFNVPDDPGLFRMGAMVHLTSDVTGVPAEGLGSLRLADRLHPSPTVAGYPVPAALGALADLEGVDRGRYAGPVGWADPFGQGEWALALRCARLDPADPHRATLFAATGVRTGTDPEAAFADTEAKLGPVLAALSASDG